MKKQIEQKDKEIVIVKNICFEGLEKYRVRGALKIKKFKFVTTTSVEQWRISLKNIKFSLVDWKK